MLQRVGGRGGFADCFLFRYNRGIFLFRYKRTKDKKTEDRSAYICMQENSFYVDTVKAP